MRSSFGSLAVAGLLVLTGCTNTPEPRIHYKEAKTAVAVGCVVDRPAKSPNLLTTHPDGLWNVMPPGSKASAFEARAGERMTYEDNLETATAGCRDAHRP